MDKLSKSRKAKEAWMWAMVSEASPDMNTWESYSAPYSIWTDHLRRTKADQTRSYTPVRLNVFLRLYFLKQF